MKIFVFTLVGISIIVGAICSDSDSDPEAAGPQGERTLNYVYAITRPIESGTSTHEETEEKSKEQGTSECTVENTYATNSRVQSETNTHEETEEKSEEQGTSECTAHTHMRSMESYIDNEATELSAKKSENEEEEDDDDDDDDDDDYDE